MDVLQIRMLGDLSLSTDETCISFSENRSWKVQMLLAYLIYRRQDTVSQDELLELLWNRTESQEASPGILKTTMHRVRASLDALWPSAGHDLILRRGSGYVWNNAIPAVLDIDEFERLCSTESDDEEKEVQLLLKAVHLYKGDFLSHFVTAPWLVPITAYYHDLYVRTLLKLLPKLMDRGQVEEAAQVCRTAIELEPHNQELHCYMMRALLALGDAQGVVEVYKALCDHLLSSFGIIPDEEARKLYREATKTFNNNALPIEVILDQIREPDSPPGALMCEYDFFMVLCHLLARSMVRSGTAIHIALLSVTGEDGGELSKRSLPRAMENLENQVRINLRRGDAASRCSASQFVLMLPNANYENSCIVCNRIIKAFFRQYPHSPAVIQYSVRPLGPTE